VPEASLSIPPSAEHVRVARLVAVAAARRMGLTDEHIDDVRLAVGEGVSRAVARQLAEGVTGDVSMVMSDSGAEFTITITDGAARGGPEIDDGVALALIRALVPQVELADSLLILRWVQAA